MGERAISLGGEACGLAGGRSITDLIEEYLNMTKQELKLNSASQIDKIERKRKTTLRDVNQF